VSVYEVAVADVVAISVNVPVLPRLRSTEIPLAPLGLSAHVPVSWPAMAPAHQIRTVRKSSVATATGRLGLLSEITASLLQAVCEATA